MTAQRRAIDTCMCGHKILKHVQGSGTCSAVYGVTSTKEPITCLCNKFIPHPTPVLGLDPGIDDMVHILRAGGYKTTDSGDGWSKLNDPDALTYAHIFMIAHEDYMVSDAKRLCHLMNALGQRVQIQATYDPASKTPGIIAIIWPTPRAQL